MDEILGALDPSTLGMGVDASAVIAVSEATNLIKGDMRKWGLDGAVGRLYPAIPFLVAFGLGLLYGNALWSDALWYSGKIGLLSSFAWQGYRVSMKGK